MLTLTWWNLLTGCHSLTSGFTEDERSKVGGLSTVAESEQRQATAITGAEDGSEPAGEASMRLLRQVCHDVRQELAVIQALVALVADQSELSEQSSRRLDQISERASYITEMMQAIVQRATSFAELDLAPFVSAIVADVQLRTTTSCRLQAVEVSVVAEPMLLRRALLNMLDNAVRAAGPTGSVTAWIATDAADVLIEVADDGPGFGQAMPGLASLGLAVVRDCAQAHGGRVESGTRAGGGAFIRLRLPRLPSDKLEGLPDR